MQMVLGNKTIFGTVNANKKHFKSGIKHMGEFEKMWPGLLEKMITKKIGFNDFEHGLSKEKDDIKVVMEF